MGLQRHIRTQKKNTFNFMVDAEFLPLRNLLDTLSRRLHTQGILALAQSLKSFMHFFVSAFVRDKTALQLLEVVIHHDEIKLLGGWQAVAFATRTLERLGHSSSTHC